MRIECCASASVGSVGTGECRLSAVLLPPRGRLERESADGVLCFCLSGVGWNGRVQTECCASASVGSVGTGEYRRSAVLLPQWGRLERESADGVLCSCLSGVGWNGRVQTECCASASAGSVGTGECRLSAVLLPQRGRLERESAD